MTDREETFDPCGCRVTWKEGDPFGTLTPCPDCEAAFLQQKIPLARSVFVTWDELVEDLQRKRDERRTATRGDVPPPEGVEGEG